MTLVEHVDALRAKHAELKHAVDEENQRPHPDDLRIAELKREKLRIKDEIARLEAEDEVPA
ncbi:MAG: YdcH family protein [Rhodospirillales bacterium]|nr:YdcH family protein [Rhodospirillales bacterium]